MMTIAPRWDTLACDPAAADHLSSALNLPPVVARLLCLRGLDDPETALRFLNPVLDHLHDPLLLADMRIAVDRIMAAIAAKERTEGYITDSRLRLTSVLPLWHGS